MVVGVIDAVIDMLGLAVLLRLVVADTLLLAVADADSAELALSDGVLDGDAEADGVLDVESVDVAVSEAVADCVAGA